MRVTEDVLAPIRRAIKERKQLVFRLDGYMREMCPHALGKKNGEWHMLGWQFAGQSKSGFKSDADRWRCCEVDDMLDVQVRDGKWYRGVTSGRGSKPSSCIDEMDTLIDPAHAAIVQNI